MRGTSNKSISELQEVYNLADKQVDLCNEKATDKLLKQIQNNAKRIKKITGGYNGK